MATKTKTSHKIGTREEWIAARLKLLKEEKEHTRRGDELAKKRQQLPWLKLDKAYPFDTEQGRVTLADLFQGRSQLLVYHFMFGPDYIAGCPACSATADGFNGVLSHLKARDVTMICVSRAPIAKLAAYRKRMGWDFTWASSQGSDFNLDFGVSADEGLPHDAAMPPLESNELGLLKLLKDQPKIREQLPAIALRFAKETGTKINQYFTEGHGFSTFVREENNVYHCYSTYARGTEFLMTAYPILDRAPKGRNEGDNPMSWLRRHDEYDNVKK